MPTRTLSLWFIQKVHEIKSTILFLHKNISFIHARNKKYQQNLFVLKPYPSTFLASSNTVTSHTSANNGTLHLMWRRAVASNSFWQHNPSKAGSHLNIPVLVLFRVTLANPLQIYKAVHDSAIFLSKAELNILL